MRVLIFVLVLVAVLCICGGKRHKKRDDLIVKGKKIGISAPSANPFHTGKKYHRGERLRGQHLFGNKHLRKKDRYGRWKKFGECKTTKCGPKEFCVVHPTKDVEKCISKHDFREGRRLFRQFHKQKKHLKDDTKIKQLEKDLLKGEKMRDVFELITYRAEAKHNKLKQHKQQKHQHFKDIEKKQDAMFKEAMNEHECRPTEFKDLKKRLIGWFDMVHTLSRQEHHRTQHHKKAHKKDFDKSYLFGHMKHGKPLQRFDVMKHDKRSGRDHRQQQNRYMLKRSKRNVYDIVEKEAHGGCLCSKSVMWEFRKQDHNGDGHLTEPELYFMKSNGREPCMTALAKSCDHSGEGNLTRGEWCCCFQEIVAPCNEKKRRSNPGDWIPLCDEEGYFKREQCHNSDCWCTDLNGNTIENTKAKGKANCEKYGPNGYPIKQKF